MVTALAALMLLAGCEVSCENTCEKLLACEEVETPLVAEVDCQQACVTQETLYDGWDDLIKRQALTDYKTCVSENTCGDIAEGVCYDEDIYSW
ncbi:MAG: hypothetical protein ACI8S6_000968 [Myxococcota bacterium]|jgi:hypothetical protein